MSYFKNVLHNLCIFTFLENSYNHVTINLNICLFVKYIYMYRSLLSSFKKGPISNFFLLNIFFILSTTSYMKYCNVLCLYIYTYRLYLCNKKIILNILWILSIEWILYAKYIFVILISVNMLCTGIFLLIVKYVTVIYV